MERLQESVIAARRRAWFQAARALGLSDEDQRAIVSAHLPQEAEVICTPDGEISRASLFESREGFNSAMEHLANLAAKRLKGKRSYDGRGAGSRISAAQIKYVRDLGRRLGWDERGEEDLDYRLQTFAARQCGQGGGVRLWESLTRRDARKLIDGLKRMAERAASKREEK